MGRWLWQCEDCSWRYTFILQHASWQRAGCWVGFGLFVHGSELAGCFLFKWWSIVPLLPSCKNSKVISFGDYLEKKKWHFHLWGLHFHQSGVCALVYMHVLQCLSMTQVLIDAMYTIKQIYSLVQWYFFLFIHITLTFTRSARRRL